jgi:hypothetical protein
MQVTEFSAAEQAKLRAKLEARDRQAWRRHRATVAELQAELAKLRK